MSPPSIPVPRRFATMENGKPPVHHETVFRVSVSAPGSSRAEPAAHRVLAEVVAI